MGCESGMTLERTLRLINIRGTAQTLVGTCTEIQIIEVGMAVGKIRAFVDKLDLLTDWELESMNDWIMASAQRPTGIA